MLKWLLMKWLDESGEVATGSEESTEQNQEEGNEEVPDENKEIQDNVDANAATEEDQEAQSDEGQKDADPTEEIEQDGKKYVSAEGIQKRIDKLVAERNDARGLIDNLKNDPDARQKFVEALGDSLPTKDSSPKEPNEPSPTEKWLSNIGDKDHKSFYTGQMAAIGEELEAFIEKKFEEKLNPIMSHIGETKLSTFSAGVKDFGKYEVAVSKRMRNTPGLTVEDAYKLESYNDKVKSSRLAGQKSETTRKQKLNTPISKSPGGNKSGEKPAKSFDEAFNRNWEKLGFGDNI